jgi:hypothetical protein
MNEVVQFVLIGLGIAAAILLIMPWFAILIERYWSWCLNVQRRWQGRE